jgi:hypothetical protein
MAMVSSARQDTDIYRPIEAVSMTGTFPGFARPHFTPDTVRHHTSSANTTYVQRVLNEQIMAFEVLEQNPGGSVILVSGPAVQVGDSAVYAYAFTPENAVIGTRDVVAKIIKARFHEIAPKAFAACTAAQFARLADRLPDVNRRALSLLTELDAFSARLWRDSVIFKTALREEWVFRESSGWF